MKFPDFVKLTHQRLQTMVVLCVGMAILLGLAMSFTITPGGPIAQTSFLAATVHGTTNGLNPAPAHCNLDQTAAGMCANGTSRSAIFSVHRSDSVTSTPGACKSFNWGCLPPVVRASVGYTLTEQCSVGGGGCHAGATAGSPLVLSNGTSIALELDWLRTQYVGWPNGCWFLCGDRHDHDHFNFLASCTTNFGLITSTYDGGYHYSGSVTLTPTASQVYTVTCVGNTPKAGTAPSFTLSIPITVTDPSVSPLKPTVDIVGNGQNPLAVIVGQPITITGTYSAASGDSLLQTALNDSHHNLLPGVEWTPPTSKTYSFTPSSPGTYTFYPAVRSNAYPAWDNYSKSLTVTVSCPAGQTAPAGGTCVPGVSPPPTSVPCTGPHQEGVQPFCRCTEPYQDVGGGICSRTPDLSILVNGAATTRVLEGSPVTLTWSATGVQVGSCTVRTLGGVQIGNTESGSATPTILAQTTYRLSCLNDVGGTVSAQAVVNIIPSFEEI